MTNDAWQPPFGVPTPARIYDYLLGGKDNFEVDRIAAARIADQTSWERCRAVVWENRRFLWRVVGYLARECGIDQFVDIGAGLPTVRSTHEIVQEINPGARVAYVDNDPIVLSHGQALLAKRGGTVVVTADARDPAAIIGHPRVAGLIDFSRPVAVLFIALFHFIPGAGHPRFRTGDADPAGILATVRDRIAPGSYVAVTHLGIDDLPPGGQEIAEEVYDEGTAPIVFRSRDQVAELFQGWELVPPGLVRPWQWHSDPSEAPRTEDLWAGVARRA
jgi:hypothetical protein